MPRIVLGIVGNTMTNPVLLFFVFEMESHSEVAGTTGKHHHTQLIFVFLVKMGFHHIGQAGFELLTS